MFGTSVSLADEQPITLPEDVIIALESTRATFLSWSHDTQRRFTGELGKLLESHTTVHLTRHTSLTMAPALPRA